MARSMRKTPIYGMTTAVSEKEDKRIWHQRMRACERDRLRASLAEPEGHLTTMEREVSNRWAMDKDGRQWWPWCRQIAQAETIFPQLAELSGQAVQRERQRYLARQRYK